MRITCMSLAVWLGEERKCSPAVVGLLDLVLENGTAVFIQGAVSRAFWPFLVKTVLQYLYQEKEINQILEIGTNYDPNYDLF